MQRLASGSLSEVLDQVGSALAAGAVNVISVEAIRARSGERWPRKREQVETFVERTFDRAAQAGDLIVALNDAEFLTVQPSASRAEALGRSARLLKDTLEFFLGAAAREDLRLFEVTAFERGELTVRPVEAGRALAAGDEVAPESAAGATTPPADRMALRRPKIVSLTTASGAPLELRLSAEPTWNVAARAVASFLLQADVSVIRGEAPPRAIRPAEMSPNIAGDVALATLQYATELRENGRGVAAHAPIPLSALTYSTSRYRLLHALRALDVPARQSLIVEITDLEDGLPQSRLAELVSTVSPYCRAVLVRAASEHCDVTGWRRTGLGGVTLDCSRLEPSDRSALFRLARFAGGALQVSKACVAYGLRSNSLLLAAWAAGFTHLNGTAIGADGTIEGPMRLEPTDLFVRGGRRVA